MNRAWNPGRVWAGVAAVLMVLLAGGPKAFGQAAVKVHKELIRVTVTDETGQVQIEGGAGAIESTSTVRVNVINLTTKEKRAVEVQADGSFKAEISAKAGEQIRVTADNQEKKRSYGTFTVGAVGGQLPSASSGFSKVQGVGTKMIGAKELLSAKEDELSIGVFLNVVDLRTGQLLASRRIDGVLKEKEPEMNYAQQVKELVGRCVAVIQLELAKMFLGDAESFAPSWRKEKGETGTRGPVVDDGGQAPAQSDKGAKKQKDK